MTEPQIVTWVYHPDTATITAEVQGDGIDALSLPSITVGLFLAGGLARLIRSAR